MKILITLIILLTIFTLSSCNNNNNSNSNINTSNEINKVQYLIDVREPEEFSSGHLYNAINIPLGYIEKGNEEYMKLLSKHNEEINTIYCRSGRRSSIAKRILEEKGYKVKDLGSIENASNTLKLSIVK